MTFPISGVWGIAQTHGMPSCCPNLGEADELNRSGIFRPRFTAAVDDTRHDVQFERPRNGLEALLRCRFGKNETESDGDNEKRQQQ